MHPGTCHLGCPGSKAESQRPPDFDSAVQNLRKALELSPEFPEANLQLGIVLQAQGKLNDAIRLLEKAVSISPNLSAAHYRLALAYQRQDRKQDAQKEFDVYERLKTQLKKEDEERSVLQMLQP